MNEVQLILTCADLNKSQKKRVAGNERVHPAKRMLASVVMLMLSLPTFAAPIDVGGVTIEIPNPAGFAAITPEMPALYDFQKKSWPESGVHYLTFIQDAEIPIALRKEIPDMNRRLVVASLRDVVDKTIRSSDFSEMKTFVKTQSEQLNQQVQKAIPAENVKMNKRMFGDSGASLTINVPQQTIYPPHYESERSFAYSILNTYTLTEVDGKTVTNTASATSTYLRLRGKLLVLIAYGEKDELTWTRDTSRQWAEAILAANPSDEMSSAAESPSGGHNIDWLRSATIGLVTAGLWSAIDFARKKLASRQKKD